ncbi:MAG: alpha/beta hydrolase [Verrucomicrobiota bacterium]
MPEELQIRVHGSPDQPTLVYLPGLHGDWTLVSSFRAALAGRVRFVEFTYPRSLTWSLDEYAAAIEDALLANEIKQGWVLGESFGSQVAWPFAARNATSISSPHERAVVNPAVAPGKTFECEPERFQIQGLILAGGFVRYPSRWRVLLARRFCRDVSLPRLTRYLYYYARYAKFRHRHAPETLERIAEFIARRTELDRQAAAHRLSLIQQYDPRPIARRTRLPVYSLNGFFDPIVPWWRVRPWLRRNCPGYQCGKTILRADHNVLGTAPQIAADQVASWITA